MRWFAMLAVALVATIAIACGSDSDDGDGRVRVVTSLELFADMARNVGGDRVDVEALLPPGADPHTFEPSPGRVTDVARADVVFINGLSLEEAIEDVVRNNAGGPVVELAPDPRGREANPHLWLDLELGLRYVEAVRDAMIEIDPTGRTEYEVNAAAYIQELSALDLEIEEQLAAIPEANRRLVTFHNAFPYLAERYGLEVVSVVVGSPGQQPSARDVAELTELLSEVPAVFAEPQFSSDVLDQAAADAGVPVLELLSDAFTDDVDSYVELMRFNAAQLVEGLGGD